MALGAEMLINSIVKAIGLDSEEVKQTAAELMVLAKNAKPQIQTLINWNVEKIQNFDARLAYMENVAKRNQHALQLIAAHLGVELPCDENLATVITNQTEGNENV